MDVQGWKYDEDGYLIDIVFFDDEEGPPIGVTDIQPDDGLNTPRFLYGKWTAGSEPLPDDEPEETEIDDHINDNNRHLREGERTKLNDLYTNLTRVNSTRINTNVKRLTDIQKPDRYYMTTEESLQFTDHPNAGNAGWFLIVTEHDVGDGLVQVLIRSSRTIHEVYLRVTSPGNPGTWGLMSFNAPSIWQSLPLSNGATSGEVTPAYSASNRQLSLRGSVKAQSNLSLPVSTLPSGRRPTSSLKIGAFNSTKNQSVGLRIEADTGRMLLSGDISANDEISFDGIRFWTE